MGALWIRALGPLELSVDGTRVVLGANQQRRVLAFLALRANSVVSTDSLVEALWPGSPPRKPVPQLQVYVANLRRVLDPDHPKGEPSHRLASRSAGYVLSVDEEELDILSFQEQVTAGERAAEEGDLERGAACLRAAVGLFRGTAFPDLADVELLRPELEALEEAKLNLYQDLFDVELALGRHSSIISEVQQLVVHHRYRERLWASLILALYRSDRQADALAASREARLVFTHELGIDPGPRLRALETAVLQQDPSLAAPVLGDGHRKARQRVDNLPAETTELVGRETELKELYNLYRNGSSRLVTVTGPGGSGKTRLTLAAARQLLPHVADGVCWVDLAPLTQAEQVPAALVASLGLEITGGVDPLKVAAQYLHQRHLLLVLDNFEHVEAAWPVVVELLTAAPGLRIFVTSRSLIGVRAEQEYQLGPLALPPADPCLPPHLLQEVPSVRLLLARAKAVRPGMTLTSENSSFVTRICRRLDGLPLAIELAAAQLRHKDEAGLLADLSASLAALPAAFRDVPDRQKTLTATISWSHQLLGKAERELFDLLGVFAADPSVAAVNGVFAAPWQIDHGSMEGLLAALARHSMIRLYTDPMGSLRVSMLQPIREFARERIAARKDASLARRHAEYYVSLAQDIGPLLWGAEQVAAFRLLHADAPDLRGALLWAAGPEGSLELALRLVSELWHYWELTGVLEEPCNIAEQLVARAGDIPSALTAAALSGTATLCWLLGRNERATELHQRALRAFQEARNESGVAWATVCLAVQAAEMDNMETARELAAEAAGYPQASPRTRLAAVMILGVMAFYTGDTTRARDFSQEGVRLARALGDRWLLGVALINRADVIQLLGDYAKAEQLLHEALDSALELGAEGYVVNVLESLAGIYVDQGRSELAIRVLGAAAAYRADAGHPVAPGERQRIEAMITRARATIGPISFALNWATGQRLTLRQVLRDVHPDIDIYSLPEAGSPQQLPASAGKPVGSMVTNPAPW